MNSLIKNQKLGLLALGILAVGFLGLVLPIALQWNRWILVFALVRRLILVPLALSVIGLWLDRPKYAALIGIFLTGTLYLAPKFITIAGAVPGGRSAATIFCFVDQSGAHLEHITINVGGRPITLPKNKYWSEVAKIASLPVTDTPDLDLSADVAFTDGPSIEKQRLHTKKNGRALRHLIVFIRPERTLETIPFY
jgi:hypothetical protein